MIKVICDHCKKPIEDVMYVINAQDAHGGIYRGGKNHLHFKCVIPYWAQIGG